ncbi:MAG: GtrA family protein [Dysgonamonadaceae bacterium]|nr:GtrA family protein [Dysgonamonadaceae bacterium]
MMRNRMVKYVMVGIMNTVFGYAVYALLIWIGLHYTFATLGGTVLGILFNFKTYGILVFKNKSNTLFFKYIMVYGFLYLCCNLWIFLFKKTGIHPYISGACWLIPNTLMGFVLNNRFVYKNNKSNLS